MISIISKKNQNFKNVTNHSRFIVLKIVNKHFGRVFRTMKKMIIDA